MNKADVCFKKPARSQYNTKAGRKFVSIQVAVKFFKEEKGFDRLLADMSAMYARYGRAYGAVRLTSPMYEEERAISEFFNRDYFDQALIRISLGDFERQLEKSFAIKMEVLLAEYSDRYATTEKTAFADGVIKSLMPKYRNTFAAAWLEEMLAHTRRTYKPWLEQYVNEPAKVIAQVDTVAELVNNLPVAGELVRLAAFSPLELDFYSEHGALLLRALAHRFGTSVPSSMEESIGLYYNAGLLTGGVLSQVTVRGLDTPDEVCAIHNRRQQAHVLTLENIPPQIKSYSGRAFIIENPHVFAAVNESLHDQKCTLISPIGSNRTAFMQLLKQLHAEGDNLYYCGNMDYKGLANADKLYLQFGKNFIPWRYSKLDYELILEKSTTLLPDDKKDLSMHNEDLASLLSLMRKTGKTASQMPLVPYLAEDVKNKIAQ